MIGCMGHEKTADTSLRPTTNNYHDSVLAQLIEAAENRGLSNFDIYEGSAPSCDTLMGWEDNIANKLKRLLEHNTLILSVPKEVAEGLEVPEDIMITGFEPDRPEGELPVVHYELERQMTVMKFCHLLALGGTVELASRFGIELSA